MSRISFISLNVNLVVTGVQKLRKIGEIRFRQIRNNSRLDTQESLEIGCAIRIVWKCSNPQDRISRASAFKSITSVNFGFESGFNQ